MSDEQYDSYGGAFGIQKICDPACVLQSAVKPKDPANQFGTLRCDQTICVIDDVSISILGQSTVGDINFAQACASCTGGAGCSCNISDISITAVESTINDINFGQNCGNVNCWQSDANGIPQQVDCSVLGGSSEETGGTTSPPSAFSDNMVLIIIGIIVAIVILAIIIILLLRRRQEEPSRFRMGEQSPPAPPPAFRYTGPGTNYNTYGSPIQQAPMF